MSNISQTLKDCLTRIQTFYHSGNMNTTESLDVLEAWTHLVTLIRRCDQTSRESYLSYESIEAIEERAKSLGKDSMIDAFQLRSFLVILRIEVGSNPQCDRFDGR